MDIEEVELNAIRRGDEKLHYVDNSHRWLCPDPDADQEAWTDRVRAHVEEHRDNDPPRSIRPSLSRRDADA